METRSTVIGRLVLRLNEITNDADTCWHLHADWNGYTVVIGSDLHIFEDNRFTADTLREALEAALGAFL
jgi:hypothetical protein